MNNVTAEVRGDAIRAALNAARDAAASEIAARAGGYARALAPVDTGALRASIVHAAENGTVTVGSSLDYAPYVELGARPFLRPALEDHLSEYREVVETALKGTT